MNMSLKSRLVSQRIELQWSLIIRLRKKAEKRFLASGGINTRSFLTVYRRLDRRCAKVMTLSSRYTEISGYCGKALPEVTAALV